MNRVDRVRALLDQRQLDALLVSAPTNRRYVSGFTGSAGFLLITASHTLLIVDGRYTTQAATESPGWTVRKIDPPAVPLAAVLDQELPALGVRRLGFEAAHLTVAQHMVLTTALSALVEFVPTEDLIEPLREHKDATELAVLEQAVAIGDRAFARVCPLLRPTMREREAAWEIEKALRAEGADGPSFPVIVAAGPNSARPHARPTDDELGYGRPVIMDFGALVQGYHGDMTRTVILGEANEQFTRLYELVRKAHQEAVYNVRVGMTGEAADALARDVLSAAGQGEAFSHNLGHGVGLAIHEGPSLRRGNMSVLSEGMVFSVEPGVYLPPWGGIRIEDLVLLDAAGVRVLTQAPKEPVVTVNA